MEFISLKSDKIIQENLSTLLPVGVVQLSNSSTDKMIMLFSRLAPELESFKLMISVFNKSLRH